MSFYNTNNISTTTVSTNFFQLSNTTNSSRLSPCTTISISTSEMSVINMPISILTILSNVLFCYRIYKTPRQHNSSIILTVNFSITLILIGLFSLFIIFPFDHPKGVIGSIDVFNAVWSFSFAALPTTVTTINVERYFAINRRESYKKHSTPVKMRLIVLFIWIYLLIWVAVTVYFFKHVENVKGNKWNIQHVFYTVFFIIHVWIIIFSTPLLYLIIRHVKGLRERAQVNDEIEGRDKHFIAIMMLNIFYSGVWIVFLLSPFTTMDCMSTRYIYVLPVTCFTHTIYLHPILSACIHFKHLKNRFCNCRCFPDGSRPDDGENLYNPQAYEEI